MSLASDRVCGAKLEADCRHDIVFNRCFNEQKCTETTKKKRQKKMTKNKANRNQSSVNKFKRWYRTGKRYTYRKKGSWDEKKSVRKMKKENEQVKRRVNRAKKKRRKNIGYSERRQ